MIRNFRECTVIDPRRAAIDRPVDHQAMQALYRHIVELWNQRNAADLARCFDLEGELITPDGRSARGREAIHELLRAMFQDASVPRYAVEEARTRKISFHAGILCARVSAGDAGHVVHSMVACSEYDEWLVELFQASPSGE